MIKLYGGNPGLPSNDVVLDKSDAIELHEAIAPWESRTAPYFTFVIILGLSSIGGLIIGSVIDNIVEWGQGNQISQTRLSALQWFLLQIWANITVLFIMNRLLKIGFVPWLLITLAGFLFTLNLVNVQNSLVSNALVLLKF